MKFTPVPRQLVPLAVLWMLPWVAQAAHNDSPIAQQAGILVALTDQALVASEQENCHRNGRTGRRLVRDLLEFRELALALGGAQSGAYDGDDDDDLGGWRGSRSRQLGPGGVDVPLLVRALMIQGNRVESSLYRIPLRRTRFIWDEQICAVLRDLDDLVGGSRY